VTDGANGKGASRPPLIDYPLDYAFKVMGLATDGFEGHARALVVGAAGVEPVETRVRASSGGKYLSVTVVVRLESEAQRRAVYLALHADARVLYVL
jgi:putative lipoic acid-binding regulatory protein